MFLHVMKKVEVCSMLAKLSINLKKDFESMSIIIIWKAQGVPQK